MSTTPKVYVICDQNCKFEGMTKEQILTAIIQAVNEGTIRDIDAGFVQTIKTINGVALKFFVGEQSEYNKLSDDDKKDLFAIITNDNTKTEMIELLGDLKTRVDALTVLVENTDLSAYDSALSDHNKRISANTKKIEQNAEAIENVANEAATVIEQISTGDFVVGKAAQATAAETAEIANKAEQLRIEVQTETKANGSDFAAVGVLSGLYVFKAKMYDKYYTFMLDILPSLTETIYSYSNTCVIKTVTGIVLARLEAIQQGGETSIGVKLTTISTSGTQTESYYNESVLFRYYKIDTVSV